MLRRRCRPPTVKGSGHRPAHVRNALASYTGGDTQDEARAALHGVRIPQARRVRSASLGAVCIARLMRGRSPATLAVDKCLQANIPSVRLGSIARPAFLRDPDLHEVRLSIEWRPRNVPRIWQNRANHRRIKLLSGRKQAVSFIDGNSRDQISLQACIDDYVAPDRASTGRRRSRRRTCRSPPRRSPASPDPAA